jgi:hypothetical protein
MRKYIDLEDFDANLTVAQLKEALSQEEAVNKLKEKKEIEDVKSEFENIYLKEIKKCPVFGETLNAYYLKKCVRNERTTEWSLIYYFKGEKVSFSKRNINKRDFNPDRSGESFSEKDLRKMSVITKEEYDKYIWHYNEISKQLKNLIKL